MKIIEDISKFIQEKRISVLKLSTDTGIPSYRIYKWIDGKAKPKYEDVQKLEEWLNVKLGKQKGPIQTGPKTDELKLLSDQVKALNAVVETLIMEVASLRAEKNGENVLTVIKRLQKAAELPV